MKVIQLETNLYSLISTGVFAYGTKRQLVAYMFADMELSAETIQDLFKNDDLIDTCLFFVQENDPIID